MNFKLLHHNGKNNFGTNKLFNLIIITSIILNTALIFNNKIFAKNRFCDIYIINKRDQKIKLNVEVAETDMSKSRGLMFRKSLEKDSGMLFLFDKEIILNFWMKNTYIPLSIAYISKDGIINEIYLMQPLDTSVTYSSRKESMFALEVNQGWFKNNNITEGCRIVFNGCIGKQD